MVPWKHQKAAGLDGTACFGGLAARWSSIVWSKDSTDSEEIVLSEEHNSYKFHPGDLNHHPPEPFQLVFGGFLGS